MSADKDLHLLLSSIDGWSIRLDRVSSNGFAVTMGAQRWVRGLETFPQGRRCWHARHLSSGLNGLLDNLRGQPCKHRVQAIAAPWRWFHRERAVDDFICLLIPAGKVHELVKVGLVQRCLRMMLHCPVAALWHPQEEALCMLIINVKRVVSLGL